MKVLNLVATAISLSSTLLPTCAICGGLEKLTVAFFNPMKSGYMYSATPDSKANAQYYAVNGVPQVDKAINKEALTEWKETRYKDCKGDTKPLCKTITTSSCAPNPIPNEEGSKESLFPSLIEGWNNIIGICCTLKDEITTVVTESELSLISRLPQPTKA